MKMNITRISALLALTATTLHAHHGGPDHEHWPFPDIKWAIVIVALSCLAVAIYKMRKKA